MSDRDGLTGRHRGARRGGRRERLRLDSQSIGAVVAGYGLPAFPDEAAVRRFTLRYGLPFLPAWRAIRHQAPLPKLRLRVHAELLAALAETLLGENVRAQGTH